MPRTRVKDDDDLAIMQNVDGSWTVSGVWDPGDPANTPISDFADLLTTAQPG